MENILSREPVNKTARAVTSRSKEKGNDYSFKNERHWENMPHIKHFAVIPKTETDLRGVKFGHFTVIGKYAPGETEKKPAQALWIVRCDCGHFEARRKKSIMNPNNYGDRCGYCRRLVFLKREDIRRRVKTADIPNVMDL